MTGTDLALRSSAPIATPLPSPEEWRGLVAIATTLANTRIVPKPYQDNRDDIIAAALLGRNIGLDPMQSLLYVHVIEGKPSLSAECMVALVRREGHTIRALRLDDEMAHVEGVRRDDGQRADFMFTRQHMIDAELDGKANWKGYFRSMAWARAVSQLCRMLFPDVISGMSYVPEELGAEVDGDGTPVGATVRAGDVPAALAPAADDGGEEETVDAQVMEPDDDPDQEALPEAEDATVVPEEEPTRATPQELADAIPGVTLGEGGGVPADPTAPAPIAPEDVDPYAMPEAGAADDDPYATPPPPEPTPEQAHRRKGRDLFPKGWPAKGRSGDMKGRDPWEVSDDDLRWKADQVSTNPKYAEKDAAQRAWCIAELKLRTDAAVGTGPAPVTGSVNIAGANDELDAAFADAVAAEPDPTPAPVMPPIPPDDLYLEDIPDDMGLTPSAREQMAQEMADHGYATSVAHGLERIAALEAKGGFTAARARANVAHFRANPAVAK